MKIKLVLSCVIGLFLFACKPSDKHEVTVGIIEPLQHAALDEVVKGFSETIKNNYPHPVNIKVENAQNDMNLQRAIIQKMRNAHYDFIVPIGLSASQMSLAMVKDISVISLASDLTQENRQNYQTPLAIVHDQISADTLVKFIHAVYPHKHKFILIHSAADKVFPEVEQVVKVGQKCGLTIKPLMVSTLPDLYHISQSLPADAEGIIVLKDHLIVSGISVLTNFATKMQIPLISSDEGSVINGASFALGVPEQQIGKEGANLVIAALNGKSVKDLPIVDIKNLSVFINAQSLAKENQNIEPILKEAKTFNYHSKLYGI